MRVWNCIVFAMFVAACTSSSDPGDPPDPGPDPQVPGSGDAGADQQPPAPAPSGTPCAEPGAVGNAGGVGEYCTPGGGECDDNESATYCTVDFREDAPPFCTILCFSDGACGEDAVCASDGGSGPKGCAPTCLEGL
jgi:hypothetical protein